MRSHAAATAPLTRRHGYTSAPRGQQRLDTRRSNSPDTKEHRAAPSGVKGARRGWSSSCNWIQRTPTAQASLAFTLRQASAAPPRHSEHVPASALQQLRVAHQKHQHALARVPSASRQLPVPTKHSATTSPPARRFHIPIYCSVCGTHRATLATQHSSTTSATSATAAAAAASATACRGHNGEQQARAMRTKRARLRSGGCAAATAAANRSSVALQWQPGRCAARSRAWELQNASAGAASLAALASTSSGPRRRAVTHCHPPKRGQWVCV